MIANTNPPLMLTTLEFLAAGWTRLVAERFQSGEHALDQPRWELVKFFLCAWFKFN
jgi:hypothetical protein